MAATMTLAVLSLTAALPSSAAPIVSWQNQADGVTFHLTDGTLKVQVCTPRVLRVLYGPAAALPRHKSLSVIQNFPPTAWHLAADSRAVTLNTGTVQAQVNRRTGAVRFLDAGGNSVLSETPGGRALTPAVLPGMPPEPTYRSQQSFVMAPDEDIYGLGQHQDHQGAAGPYREISYRGTSVKLEQDYIDNLAIPFLVSSRGYGLLWDNPSSTTVDAGATAAEPIPAAQLESDDGKPAGLTARYYQGQDLTSLQATRTDPQVDFNWTSGPVAGLGQENFSVRWTGFVRAQEGGDYTFVTTSDDGVRLWIDGRPVIDDWNVHPAKEDRATVHFAAHSRHALRMEYFQNTRDAVARLAWRHGPRKSTLSWTSEAAGGVDYYFCYGPTLDGVIADFRGLTGQAPMPGRWALGFWQCKERYQTQQEWLDIAQGYRSRREPIDNLVQDWYYWDPHPWGSHKFDPKRYPDPAAAIAQLHDQYHLHFMISVWGKFDPGSPSNPNANFQAMNARGYLYPPLGENARYYDAFNPDARALYWGLMRDQLFSKGVDAWWLDASEPEVNMASFRAVPTAQGRAARVLNAWPLMHTTGVYQGQRAAAPNKRVFILTRSAFAGEQRNAAAVWSSDITGTWDVFAHQVTAGLNFCLSGMPYWTTDIGGFFVGYPGGSQNPEYRELFTRWFQWGAFCPIFRVHGTSTPKELWRFGPQYEPILVKYDNLRYRLLPYLYSQAWQVTSQGGTLMRALVMDFPQDVAARRSRDEFLFGPALLVCPVTQQGASSRRVHLPAGTHWTDFWTGRGYVGGQDIMAPAPIDTLPLYVRAGSIVPMGPFLQYAAEKPADPIELRVYRGANGAFTFYEDEGDSYRYERGVYATIPITWNESAHTLTIGARAGKFPGMLTRRTFRIVWVRPGRGAGLEPATPDQAITYNGQAVVIKAPGR
ncbi:MAG: DUF5110 domain-containing protein [Armatimonadetes bacterium]|nr:DUF5110 domain-containing protein [Armatimonadota bacterium]